MRQIVEAEGDTLAAALQAFEREVGLGFEVMKQQIKVKGVEVDATLKLQGQKKKLAVEVKRWAQQTNIGALINQIGQLPQPALLVADYINPNMADKLREQDIQFIDTAGNAYINMAPTYIFVKGNRTELTVVEKREINNRAFEPTGLKVIYAFLCDPDLVNAPYRAIAERAGVALGTIGWVLNGLKDTGLVIDRGGKNGRRLANYKKLLDRWVEVYPEKLKPKQKVGDFIAADPNWWKDFNIAKYQAYWGGEVAAAKYTKYLKPEIATIYLPTEAGNKLLVAAKLKKAVDKPGNVKIYRPIGLETDNKVKGLVNPVLVYADLIATADTRNLETAEKLYDEYIAQYCRED